MSEELREAHTLFLKSLKIRDFDAIHKTRDAYIRAAIADGQEWALSVEQLWKMFPEMFVLHNTTWGTRSIAHVVVCCDSKSFTTPCNLELQSTAWFYGFTALQTINSPFIKDGNTGVNKLICPTENHEEWLEMAVAILKEWSPPETERVAGKRAETFKLQQSQNAFAQISGMECNEDLIKKIEETFKTFKEPHHTTHFPAYEQPKHKFVRQKSTSYESETLRNERKQIPIFMPVKKIVEDSGGNKVCAKCGISKPAADYHRCSAAKDGLQGYCKDCAKLKIGVNESKPPNLEKAVVVGTAKLLDGKLYLEYVDGTIKAMSSTFLPAQPAKVEESFDLIDWLEM